MIELDVDMFNKMPFFSWRKSYRLRFGSLVLFSATDFETFTTGLIRNAEYTLMDIDMPQTGKCHIFVAVVGSSEPLFETYKRLRGKDLMLFESKCYFKNFLDCLQDLKKDKVPFPDIFRRKPHSVIRPPKFLLDHPDMGDHDRILDE